MLAYYSYLERNRMSVIMSVTIHAGFINVVLTYIFSVEFPL
jgi:hypothetical protein